MIAGEQHLQGHGYELLRRMRKDTRLRWASLLVVRWEEIWSDTLSVPALDRLESALATLAEADTSLIELGQIGEAFDTRLEITGPARLLRALVTTPHAVRMTVNNPRLAVSIRPFGGLDRRRFPRTVPHEPNVTYDGALALAACSSSAPVACTSNPVQQPAVTNVMSTIDVALNMAESEKAPIAPSIPMPHSPSLPPPPVARAARRAFGRRNGGAPPEPGAATLHAQAPRHHEADGGRVGRLGLRARPVGRLVSGLAVEEVSRRVCGRERAACSRTGAFPSPKRLRNQLPWLRRPRPHAALRLRPAAPAADAAPAEATAALPDPPRKAPVGKDESGHSCAHVRVVARPAAARRWQPFPVQLTSSSWPARRRWCKARSTTPRSLTAKRCAGTPRIRKRISTSLSYS